MIQGIFECFFEGLAVSFACINHLDFAFALGGGTAMTLWLGIAKHLALEWLHVTADSEAVAVEGSKQQWFLLLLLLVFFFFLAAAALAALWDFP